MFDQTLAIPADCWTAAKVWDDDKYNLFEPSLWQTQESESISAWITRRLLSKWNWYLLSEYYSKYADSEGSNINGGTKGNTAVQNRYRLEQQKPEQPQKRNRIP
ncbi:MAG: hypothetical protein ACLUOF_00710 [Ruminococcus sp.]